MTTFNIHTDNLLALYYTATPSEHHDGCRWYEYAQNYARALADEFSLPLDVCAGVIAVLSPQKAWGPNRDLAYKLFKLHTEGADEESIINPAHGQTTANLTKAYRIMTGSPCEDTEDEHGNEIRGQVRGPKVTAFYQNIMGDCSLVTLDTHALQAWDGHNENRSWTAKTKRAAMQDYLTVATVTGQSPSTVQAIIWIVKRNRQYNPERIEAFDNSDNPALK